MILAQREAFGSSPEKCGSSGSLLDVTLTFGLTFPNALHGLGSKSLRSYSQVDFGSELSSLQRCLENYEEQSFIRLGSSRQVVTLLLPRSSGDSFLFLPCVSSWPPGSRKVRQWLVMVFYVDVIIVGLRKACTIRRIVSGGLLWWMSKFGEEAWCQVNS